MTVLTQHTVQIIVSCLTTKYGQIAMGSLTMQLLTNQNNVINKETTSMNPKKVAVLNDVISTQKGIA